MRKSMVLAVFLVLVLGVAAPAWAQQDGEGGEAFVVLSGRADVPRGRTVGDLVVFHGSASVDGTVDGSLTAFDARSPSRGGSTATWSCSTAGSSCKSGANVTGDVDSQQALVVASGATIGGTSKRLQPNTNWEGFGWAGRLGWCPSSLAGGSCGWSP
jgi:hypothetical protein